MQALLDSMQAVAVAAGLEILAVYHGTEPIDVTIKADRSPLTRADTRANRLIVEQLRHLDSSLPILSEESSQPPVAVRHSWRRYWLVDPLDGTREFLSRNGEFTVNIALIEDGQPLLGVVYVPVTGVTYFGGTAAAGAWKRTGTAAAVPLHTATVPRQPGRRLRVVASRRHGNAAVDQLMARLRRHFAEVELRGVGSSLKLCWLAEGDADICPRLAPTSEWDTAAAHAILRAAGGELLAPDFTPLRYNQKHDLLNPHFVAIGDPGFDWQALLGPLQPASSGTGCG